MRFKEDTNKRIDIYNMLRELNFKITSRGFDYWIESIMMNEQSIMNIYQILADKYHTSYTNIERCMRTAKTDAIENIQKYYKLNIPLSNIMILRLIRNTINSRTKDE